MLQGRGKVRILGIDPGLRFTGWGDSGGRRQPAAPCGGRRVRDRWQRKCALRLKALDDALADLLARYDPDEAAVEETYVNRNATATLKLGYARGVALLAPARAGIPVFEYGAKTVKMAVVGTGGADKEQVGLMVRRLLPGSTQKRADAADALAVAICHAHHRSTTNVWKSVS